MIQQVMTAPGAIEFRDIPVPELKDDEVLVKIKRIGICGSDIHVYHGKHPFTKYPVTQGHEVSGQIVKLGKNVTSFRIGQKVTIEPQVTCGECYPCRHGKYNLCEELKVMGFQTTGCASEYFAAPVHRVTPLPDSMTYNQGAMIEPLAVTVHAARRFPELKALLLCRRSADDQPVVFRIGPGHVEASAGDLSLGARRRLEAPAFHLGLAAAKVRGNTGEFAVLEVAAYGVDCAYGREEVVHVCLHVAVAQVYLFRALAALEGLAVFVDALGVALAPFPKGPSEVFRRNSVFPLYLKSALGMGGSGKALRQISVLFAVKGCPAVHCDPVVVVDLPLKQALGCIEAVVCGVALLVAPFYRLDFQLMTLGQRDTSLTPILLDLSGDTDS